MEFANHLFPSGIDLASPSELVAHERDRFAIAKHIGAEEVIYQDLDDLKACCASLSPRKDQDFEVGVFCGKYITAVPDGYFEHLEGLRGKARASAPAAGESTLVANGGVTAADRSKPNGHAFDPLRSPADREDIRYVVLNASWFCVVAVLTNEVAACTTLPTIPRTASSTWILRCRWGARCPRYRKAGTGVGAYTVQPPSRRIACWINF